MARVMAVALAAVLAILVAAPVPEVVATRWTVGGRKFWNTGVNYTIWAQDKHFYNGDWLFFVYDRYQQSVLEVNKMDYDNCTADHPLHNWTGGAGRDVVPLNETRHYYIISGKGFCFGGMKLAIRVENPPPPPKAAPIKNGGGVSAIANAAHFLLPVAAFAVGAMCDAIQWLW